ncbi:hypothetical protein Bca52824_058695 [Brassica carinata]|uniref:Uncharacterized protein n=1 Tax=Brassica carinata TaxID=52824 RepID=A0A8X7QSX9_BRACI|nr:hypothetical protein Bca52824_058695 [Brassica carinata]
MSSSRNVLKRCDVETLRPQPKPSANPPETTSTHSEDATEPMEVDKAPMRRTLRKRKEKNILKDLQPELLRTENFFDEDYEEERATGYKGFKTEELSTTKNARYRFTLYEACGRGTRFYCPFTRANRPSIDTRVPPSIDIRSQPPSTDLDGYAKSVDGHALQRNIPEHQQRVANEFYNTDGEVDDHFKPKAEIDQMVEEIYKTLGAAEERLDKISDDIYFPWDMAISSLTSQTEAMQKEIVEIQRYIARRLEA